MRAPIFTGSGVAIVTPFSQDGGLDLPALDRLLDRHLESGTDAVIVCGTTGESATMSDRERRTVIERCVERIGGRIPVIAGSGSNSTAHAVELSREAEAAGADGLLLVTPYYNKASQTGLVMHFRKIADAVSLPCILYDVPSRTGVSLSPAACAELSDHPNVHGIKAASGDLGAVQELRARCPALHIWSGNDDLAVPVCVLGGVGVISVAANIVPDRIHTMMRLCQEDDFAAAGTMQVEMKPLFDALFCEVNPIPVKTALGLMGWSGGGLRLPLSPPSPEHRERIWETLGAYGLLAGA